MIPLIFALGCAHEPPRLTVLAAASLTEAFGDLEPLFEAQHDVDVVLVFAGSQTLATQLRDGLAADVFASADAQLVDDLRADGLVGPGAVFARNRLAVVTARSSPRVDLAHLPEVGRLVVGAPEVPVGVYTKMFLDRAGGQYGPTWREGVEARVVSREASVRLVTAKVALGEADAAIVYATDVIGLTDVVMVPIPERLQIATDYTQAGVTGGSALADAWMRFVSGPGQAAPAARGFSPP